MIIQTLYSVFDVKAKHFLPPFASFNDNTALRQFETAVNTSGHEFNVHPADFSLHKLGAFDAEKGTIEPVNPAELIGLAAELRSDPQANSLNSL